MIDWIGYLVDKNLGFRKIWFKIKSLGSFDQLFNTFNWPNMFWNFFLIFLGWREGSRFKPTTQEIEEDVGTVSKKFIVKGKENDAKIYVCNSFQKKTTQNKRETIKSTKDKEGVPPRTCIQSNNDQYMLFNDRQDHQTRLLLLYPESTWHIRARLTTP